MNIIAPSSRGSVPSADGTAIAYRSRGSSEGIVVVRGPLSSGEDYLPVAHALSESFAVHVVDRRGRGASGPQGSGYSIETECDLIAVHMATGATSVFGHGNGGPVALDTADEPARSRALRCMSLPCQSMDPSPSAGCLVTGSGARRRRLPRRISCYVRQAGFRAECAGEDAALVCARRPPGGYPPARGMPRMGC